MIVYFLRHASAGQHKANPAQDDKRPLDKDGIAQSTEMGRFLATANVQVDAIVSSPLKRATQTASLVGNELGFDSKLQTSPALRPDASFDSFRQLLEKHGRLEAILVVGHNPSLSHFVSLLLSGGSNEDGVDLKKGAVARVDVSSSRYGVLKWSLTPKLVRTLQESSATSPLPKTSLK